MLAKVFKQTHRYLHSSTVACFSSVSIKLIKELRELTGSSIDECRKALEAQNSDIQKATEYLKKRGLAQAEKRLGRKTQEGVIGVKLSSNERLAVVAEVYCETDFVAKTDMFVNFVDNVLQGVANEPNFEESPLVDEQKIDKLLENTSYPGLKVGDLDAKSLYEARQLSISKLQENIRVGGLHKFQRGDNSQNVIGVYVHNSTILNYIGLAVSLVDAHFEKPVTEENKKQAQDVANNLAMQILASKPNYISREDIPADIMNAEKEKVLSTLEDSLKQKPEKVLNQIIEGKLKKFYEDNVLYDQVFVLDPEEALSVR